MTRLESPHNGAASFAKRQGAPAAEAVMATGKSVISVEMMADDDYVELYVRAGDCAPVYLGSAERAAPERANCAFESKTLRAAIVAFATARWFE